MALETIEFDGESYVPSKQASSATGYTQDYIGQLARGNAILARRIGGLWYINMDSLLNHKKESEAFVPEPPVQITDKGGSIVSFDGKEYISSKRAAEITRYTQDYVGQLARGGKIASRQVSGRWYVSKDDLIAHKSQKDALLAKVQAEAVGVQKVEQREPLVLESKASTELYTYISEERDVNDSLPVMIKKEPKIEIEHVSRYDISESKESEGSNADENATHHIAIRAMRKDVENIAIKNEEESSNAPAAGYSQYRGTWNADARPERKKSNVKAVMITLGVLFVAGIGGYVITTGVVGALLGSNQPSAASVRASEQAQKEGFYQGFVDGMTKIVGGELTYTRK